MANKVKKVADKTTYVDTAGATLETYDPKIKTRVLPSGAVLDASAVTGTILFAPGEVDAADIHAGAVGTSQIASGAVGATQLATGGVGATQLATSAVTNVKIAAGAVTKAKTAMFVSTEQTGTGSAQNVAHGLGAVPAMVFVVPTDTSPDVAGVYTVVEGAHDGTNVIVTVTSGKKFKVLAWA